MRQRAALVPLLLLIGATGLRCEQQGGASKDTGDDQPPEGWELTDLAGACDSAERLGGFELVQWDSPLDGFSTVTGSVRDAVIPSTILYEKESAGDCALYLRENPYCDPACDTDETCDPSGDCIDFPLQLNLGAVDISGLEGDDLTLTTNSTNMYSDTLVSHPLFQPGAHIELQTEGGEAQPFRLRGLGVSILEVPSPIWDIQQDTDLQVEWAPSSAESRIHLSINIDQHGNSPVTLFCDTDDTGSLTIDASLLSRLVEYGVSGFATGSMERRTADSTEIEGGCVDLLIYSQVSTDITVEGHTPCYTDQQCPQGQYCDQALNTCVES